MPPPRGASAKQTQEGHDDTCDSIESYEDTDLPESTRAQNAKKHESVISSGTVYEDTDEMELHDKIAPPRVPHRNQTIPSTSSDVYEDTGHMEVSGYSNNFSSQRRILSDSSEGTVYEDTEDIPVVMGKTTTQKQDDDEQRDTFEQLPNNNKPSYVNANKGMSVNTKTNCRDTIHRPLRQDTNSENIDRTRLYYALYECNSVETGELAFAKGDIIFILHQDSDAWWTGQLNGKIGQVPQNYLSPVYEVVTTR